MLLGGGVVERVLGPHLHKLHKSNHTPGIRAAVDRDVVTISAEARLVQKGREAAARLPEVRQDLVERASLQLKEGRRVCSADLAEAILARARGRQI